jgi:adenylate kinase
MRIVLFGPPGSGKGTQAALLKDRVKLAHISTGDILREAVRLGTPAGKKAEPFMNVGQLAPDDIVNELVAERFRRQDRPENFMMDGYPRTLEQVRFFENVLQEQGLPLDRVVFLEISDDEAVRRIGGRRTCPKCKATYHIESKPPKKPGVCDVCGTALEQRSDDKEETVRERLKIYRATTATVAPYYQQRGLLREVPGEGDIETIYKAVERALK